MNYFVLILVALAGIAVGMYLARRNTNAGFIAKQMEQKSQNKQKILTFIQANGKTQNNDVEKLVGVSNATAERYLDELEKEGKLIQHGVIGQGVFYTPKGE
ncbi:MAG: winged helix-turn-helix domain-containing protein [Candidatus Gracilibacteria bacterium]|jgi:predicted HTH transcriptional regulator